MANKKTIIICCSAAFYEHANQLAQQLKTRGYNVEVPSTAERMQASNDYDVQKVKTWHKDPKTYGRKQFLASEHFDKVVKGDAILVVNDDKPGQPRYIGPNTTMEWGLAYYLKKPIYILNSVSKDSNFYEEVIGMSTAVLDGDLTKIDL
jgi:phosphoribosyl 1,2-cyclic phosphodiesterase